MSASGLMSCMRENSPPLEIAGSESGAASLSSTGGESQKRRRFHPLRNLRRIFRRRTLTSADAPHQTSISTPSSPSSSQLSSTPTAVIASVPAHTMSSSTTAAYCKSSLPSVAIADVTSSTTTSGSSVAIISSGSYGYPSTSHLISSTSGGFISNSDANATAALMNEFRMLTNSSSNSNQNHNINKNSSSGGITSTRSFNSKGQLIVGHLQKQQLNRHRDENEDSAGNNSSTLRHQDNNKASSNDLEDNREMTDCQRSFSEGRLIDSDFNRDGLSQSHDSVFSESATASSLSIVLKAELFDVLRKRRNRPDASDEDLGLPRSPTTPQRKDQTIKSNQSEISSLSLLSMASSEMDDEMSSNYGHAGDKINVHPNTTILSTSSSKNSQSDTSAISDEIDFFVSTPAGSRLSHSAAKHKMAIRPKKKGPSRPRRPKESALLPSTPEVNEDILKGSLEIKGNLPDKAKSLSLPPGVSAKIIEEHSQEIGNNVLIKRSRTEKITSLNGITSETSFESNITTSQDIIEKSPSHSSSSILDNKKDEEGGFFRRLLQRNSKRFKKNHIEGDECDMDAKSSSDISYSNSETDIITTALSAKSSSKLLRESESEIGNIEEFISSSKEIEETRKEIRKEILTEGKSSLSMMLNNFILPPDLEVEKGTEQNQQSQQRHYRLQKDHALKSNQQRAYKPKTGAAARQRIVPQDLSSSTSSAEVFLSSSAPKESSYPSASPLPGIKVFSPNNDNGNNVNREEQEKEEFLYIHHVPEMKIKSYDGSDYKKLSSDNLYSTVSETASEKTLESNNFVTALINDEISKIDANSASITKETTATSEQHYEKHQERHQTRIVGLSPFLQKISKLENVTLNKCSSEAVNESLKSELEGICPSPKQRKSVEKSKSFRYYSDNDAKGDKESYSDKPIYSVGLRKHENMPSLPDLTHSKKLLDYCEFKKETSSSTQSSSYPLGFEINDNNLMRSSSSRCEIGENSFPLSQGIYTKNIILTTSKPSTTIVEVPRPIPSPTCGQNINEIEDNIDKLVKSPFITILRKSNTCTESLDQSESPIFVGSKNSTKFTINNANENTVDENSISSVDSSPTSESEPLHKTKLQFSPQKSPVKSSFEAKPPLKGVSEKPTITEKPTIIGTKPIIVSEKPILGGEKIARIANGNKKLLKISKSEEMLSSNTGNDNERIKKSPPVGKKENKNANKANMHSEDKHPSTGLNKNYRRNSAILEKFDNSKQIPEFMKIQLNRVESMRPKSNIVLSKNVKSGKDSNISQDNDNNNPTVSNAHTRRYSNESIEITDSKAASVTTVMATSLPPTERGSLSSTENVNIFVATKRNSIPSPASAKIQPAAFNKLCKLPNSENSNKPTNSNRRNSTKDEENYTFRNMESKQQANSSIMSKERRKSVTDEKLKYEKKIEELKEKEKKPVLASLPIKSISNTSPIHNNDDNSHKVHIDEETGVILRKKSIPSVNNQQSQNQHSLNGSTNDSTPELIKVFARRSLKVKDEDFQQTLDEIASETTATSSILTSSLNSSTTTSLKKFTANLDSDKENQSSSEEKLDKLPKVEITIQQLSKQSPHSTVIKPEERNRPPVSEYRKSSPLNPSGTGPLTNKAVSGNQYVRNYSGYRSISSIMGNNKTSLSTSSSSTPVVGGGAITSNSAKEEFSSDQKKNKLNNNNTINITTNPLISNSNINNNITTSSNNNGNNYCSSTNINSNNNNSNNNNDNCNITNNNNNRKMVGIRHTIGPSVPINSSTATGSHDVTEISSAESEFKGILQRKAEWEKRAKEALK